MDLVSSLLSNDSAELERAEALAAYELVRNLEGHCESRRDGSEWTGKPAWRPERAPGIPYALREATLDAIRQDDKLRRELGEHREVVTAVEARNAARLRTLLWALEKLRQADERRGAKLEDWIRRHYRIAGSLVTEGPAERRRFATVSTRDLSALPWAWRQVG